MTSEADEYVAIFSLEHRRAHQEWIRLCQLLKDVLWYNFEVEAKTWRRPWHESMHDSFLCLYGRSYVDVPVHSRGHVYETGYFPIFYEGCVGEAPHLPVEIIAREVRAAKEYLDACKSQIGASYDWAPGGHLYNALCRTTPVGRKFSQSDSEDEQ